MCIRDRSRTVAGPATADPTPSPGLVRWHPSWGNTQADDEPVGPPPLKKGERLEVYWTEDRQWFPATFVSSLVEEADGGGKQRTSRVLYDAVGLWANCNKKDLMYAHCLDDEIWRREA